MDEEINFFKVSKALILEITDIQLNYPKSIFFHPSNSVREEKKAKQTFN